MIWAVSPDVYKRQLQALEENEIHLILLDVMMPKMDGLNTTVKIRETLNIPIIILSAKSEDTDKILGLNFGADDYITKPFNPLELLARVKSQMRRYTSLGSIAEKSNVIKIGGLELDKDAKEVRVEGEPVKLTATEYGISVSYTHLDVYKRQIPHLSCGERR